MENIQDNVEQLEKEAKEKFQRESFPSDPVMLLKIHAKDVDGEEHDYFAIPKDYENPSNARELVYFDVIRGDSIFEMAFIGCSVTFTKCVFGSFNDIRNITSLTVIDNLPEFMTRVVRTSKVLRGIPGINFKTT